MANTFHAKVAVYRDKKGLDLGKTVVGKEFKNNMHGIAESYDKHSQIEKSSGSFPAKMCKEERKPGKEQKRDHLPSYESQQGLALPCKIKVCYADKC